MHVMTGDRRVTRCCHPEHVRDDECLAVVILNMHVMADDPQLSS